MKYLKLYENIDFDDFDFEEEQENILTKEDLKNTVISISNNENYMKIMELLEKLNFKWLNGSNPTKFNYFDDYPNSFSIKIDNTITYSDIHYYKVNNSTYRFLKDTDII